MTFLPFIEIILASKQCTTFSRVLRVNRTVMWYSQRVWIWVVGCGLFWPHKSGSSPPYCGWHSWHSSAASHRAWAEHKLQSEYSVGRHRWGQFTGIKLQKKSLWRSMMWKTKQINLQSKTLASEISLTAAASTMFLMTNFLMALSLGTQRAQLVQRMGCTCPRPFLARPLFLLFLVCKNTRDRDTNYRYSLSTRVDY